MQVTLFRSHQHHVSPEAYQHRSFLKLGDNPTFLLLYANGKSAVRVMPGVSQLGPHYFTGPPSQRCAEATRLSSRSFCIHDDSAEVADPFSRGRWVSEDNPLGAWRSVISESCIVLHVSAGVKFHVVSLTRQSC